MNDMGKVLSSVIKEAVAKREKTPQQVDLAKAKKLADEYLKKGNKP